MKCQICKKELLSVSELRTYHNLQQRFQDAVSSSRVELLLFIEKYKKRGYCTEQFVGAGIAFMEHIPTARAQ